MLLYRVTNPTSLAACALSKNMSDNLWRTLLTSSSSQKESIKSKIIGHRFPKKMVDGLQFARSWNMDRFEANLVTTPSNMASYQDYFDGLKVLIFGIPAPFTGTCTNYHVPGYAKLANDLKAKGIDHIFCFSVSDPYSMDAWRESMGIDNTKVTFVVDPGARFTNHFGIASNLGSTGLGQRCLRFHAIVDDGKVTDFEVVEDAAKDAENVLKKLSRGSLEY